MNGKKTGIKSEITIFTLVLTAAAVGALSFFAVNAQKKSLISEVESRGQNSAAITAKNIADFILMQSQLDSTKILKDIVSGKGVVYAFVSDENGIITASSDAGRINTKLKAPERAGMTPGGYALNYGDNGEQVIDFTSPVIAKGRLKLGTVHLGIDYSIIEEPIRNAYVNFGIITLFVLLLGAAGSMWLGAAITKPVRVLAKGAELIGNGNLDHFIDVDSNNEIGALADSFNKMTKTLKTAHAKDLLQRGMQKELEIAREIQLSIIPKDLPSIPGYKLSAFYRAAEEVGGDYYDILPVSDTRTGVIVADVSGKGVPAALITTMMSTMMHSEANETDDPRLAILSVNTKLRKKIRRGIFITAFYGILDRETNTVEMVSAGHNETLVYRAANGAVDQYTPQGFPIAMGPTELLEGRVIKESFRMAPGDKIVVFTDGITEAKNKAGGEFGIENLLQNVSALGKYTGERVLNGIMDSVQEFIGGHIQSDDIAVVVLERLM